MITAVVTSDNHLGIYYSRLRPDRLEMRRRRFQQAFAKVVDAAIAHKADLFLHAGDLFDRPDPRNADRVFVARQVRRLRDAGIPVFAIAGNHDSPRSLGYDGGLLPQEEMDALGAVRLFRGTDALQSETITIRGQTVCIRGMSSDFNREPGACPLVGLTERAARGGDVDLVLLHYGVQEWAREDNLEPCLALENLDNLRADAICVGHLHTRNQRRLPGGALLLNPGATEHVNFGEEALTCGFWILRCVPGNVEGEYMTLTPQPMRTLEIDITEMPMEADADSELDAPHPLMQALLARIEAVANAEQLLRVRLGGRILRSRYHHLDLNRVQVCGGAGNFHCQVETEGLAVYDEFSTLSVGYGVSFEVEKELQAAVREMKTVIGDDPTQQKTLQKAGEAIAEAYARLMGTASA